MRSAKGRSTSRVSSTEPSSITSTSRSERVCASALSTACDTHRAELYAGMMTLTDGLCAGVLMRWASPLRGAREVLADEVDRTLATVEAGDGGMGSRSEPAAEDRVVQELEAGVGKGVCRRTEKY